MLNLTDHFLVAMPSIRDNLFCGSLVYVTKHEITQGAVGVIVNKPIGKKLQHAFKDLDFGSYNPKWSDNMLYLGGPMSSDNGFVLHRTSDKKVGGISFELTNSRDVLDEIAQSKDKDNLFVSIGYSAWGMLQVEDEISNNDWLVVKADSSLIFDVDASDRYNQALRCLGITDVSSLYCGGAVFA